MSTAVSRGGVGKIAAAGWISEPYLLPFGRQSSSRTMSIRSCTTPSTVKTAVATMRERFRSQDPGTAWETLWKDGITPWDLGGPTRVLVSELNDKHASSSSSSSSFRIPQLSLIPGCGSGHDVVSLARYLDDRTGMGAAGTDSHCTVVGLELSETSLEKARMRTEQSLDKDGPLHRTTILLYHGDFFHTPSQWNPVYTSHHRGSPPGNTPFPHDQTFDFIFDYTFFCAISPDLRPQWGEQMAQLMAPDGKLLTLMFPYHDDDSVEKGSGWAEKGPPYLVSVEMYRQALEVKGLQMETTMPYESISTVPQRQGQEVVGWWYKSIHGSSKL